MLTRHEKAGEDTAALMADIGARARAAARPLAVASAERKHAALIAMADAIRRGEARDPRRQRDRPQEWRGSRLGAAFMDRLKLTPARIRDMADGVRAIAELRDPVGEVIAEWDRPNGLHIERVRTPLGVIGVIYESRPNVTADAGALCLKAGNPVILRGGSDSLNSSPAIHACLVEGLKAAGLPEDAIQLVPTTDRAAVGEMLKGLVRQSRRDRAARRQEPGRARAEARRACRCSRISKASAISMSTARPISTWRCAIAVNAKMRRTGICGAAETLLVDRAVAATHLVPILDALAKAGCEIRATDEVRAVFPQRGRRRPTPTGRPNISTRSSR